MTGIGRDAAQAVLTVDLDALKANWRLMATRAAPARCGAVVKADGYGIGIAQAVPALARAGCRVFFVAHLGEGVRARMALRDAGFGDAETIVYLLHGLQPGAFIHPDLERFALQPILGSPPELQAWAAAGARPCAIQIDTGMNRIGIDVRGLDALPHGIVAATGAALVISHFVAAEEPADPLNGEQIERFETACATFFPGLSRSLENSSGHLLPQQPTYALSP